MIYIESYKLIKHYRLQPRIVRNIYYFFYIPTARTYNNAILLNCKYNKHNIQLCVFKSRKFIIIHNKPNIIIFYNLNC